MSPASEDVRVVDDRCPRWCALDHSGSEVALLHESRAQTLHISRRHDMKVPESVDVRVVQYLLDDLHEADVKPGVGREPGEGPSVELAYHVGGRYRVIGLSPHEARRLAWMLLDGASRAVE